MGDLLGDLKSKWGSIKSLSWAKKIFITSVLSVGLIAFSHWGFSFLSRASFQFSKVEAAPSKNNTIATAVVETVKFNDLYDSLVYPARVISKIQAVSTADTEAQIIEIKKSIGAPVKKNEHILTLKNIDPVYQYAPVRVRSLTDGYLTTLDVQLLSRVQRGQKLFTVTDPKNLVIQVEIPEKDIQFLKIGSKGAYKATPQATEAFEAHIEGLSPLVDPRTGTATAEFVLEKHSPLVFQGQLGQIIVQVNKRSSYSLPESALVYKEGQPFVRVIENKKILRRSVVLGPRVGDRIEIKNGLTPGELIALRTNRYVKEGEEIKVEPSEETKNE